MWKLLLLWSISACWRLWRHHSVWASTAANMSAQIWLKTHPAMAASGPNRLLWWWWSSMWESGKRPESWRRLTHSSLSQRLSEVDSLCLSSCRESVVLYHKMLWCGCGFHLHCYYFFSHDVLRASASSDWPMTRALCRWMWQSDDLIVLQFLKFTGSSVRLTSCLGWSNLLMHAGCVIQQK